MVPHNLRPVLDEMIAEIDQLCTEYGAFCYMHTRTSRSRGTTVDPNEAYAAVSASAAAERRAF